MNELNREELSIRLEMVGGGEVRQEFKAIERDGTRSFNQITNVIISANDNIKVINETAKTFSGVLKHATLVKAYLGFQELTSGAGNYFQCIVSINKKIWKFL